ncbi:hypothetical protein [Halobellus ordinarius]|uniref:hypothetical protein n=1 Tax=Halobellus ordinarius TaxID=3075120 RepID=UPI0028804546|nr:hypothetical protein [Halobellus sp. ZY16]
MTGCVSCSAPTPRRKCKQCSLVDRAEELVDDVDDYPECPECGGETTAEGVECYKYRKSEDAEASFSSADGYPRFSDRADLYYRLKLRSAYDRSYANAELRAEVAVPSNRYLTVQNAEGTGDTDFDDITSWSEVTSQFDNEGEEVTIDSTIQPGQTIAFNANYLVTGDERDAIESSGVVGGPIDDSGGGPLSNIPVIGVIVAALGAVWARIRGLF